MRFLYYGILAFVLSFSYPISSFSTSGETGHTESEPLRELYRIEHENWLEYIKRFSDYRLDNSFDVTFYHINVDIALDSQYITGDVRCQFEISSDNLDFIKLNLQDSLSIDSITGNSILWTSSNDTILINLDREYDIGETAEVHIYYQGKPPIVENTKGLRYSSHGDSEPVIASLSTPFLAHYWWPCKDGPGDKPDSVYIDITIPDTVINELPLIAVSNGSLEGITPSGGKKTFHWRERYPIVTYYVMVAVSNFVYFQDFCDGGPDESYPLDYYSFLEDLDSSVAGVVRVPEVAALFSELFGPYPFRDEKYGITEIGFYGGIENQTNTIQGSMEPDWFPVTVHEFAHMWFGDMITCKDWHHGWLNEGFATYAEALWVEQDQGVNSFRSAMEDKEYFGGGSLYLQNISDPMSIFIGIIYYKGAWALHMLRHVLGDEIFFDCLSQYATSPDFMYGHATTEDFQEVCESVSGIDLGWFFQQWVYGQYFPRYNISIHTRKAPGVPGSQYETHIHLWQSQTTDPQVFTMPLDFRLWYGSGYTIQKGWNDAREQNLVFNTTFQPDSIDFDPFNWILDYHYYHPYTLHIISDSLLDGSQADYYEDTIVVICSSDQYDIQIISGSLPDGWLLDPNTGVISGTSYADTGLFAVTVMATDIDEPSYVDTKSFSIYVRGGTHDPGDANADGEINVGDAVYIINYIFKYGPPPPYLNWADVNADCNVNVGDAVYLINYIFKGGPEPQMGCAE